MEAVQLPEYLKKEVAPLLAMMEPLNTQIAMSSGEKQRKGRITKAGITDVWTSAGVLVGISLVAVTGWQWLDPVVALAVGVNILGTGFRLLRGSMSGLLSGVLPEADHARVEEVLNRYRAEQVEFAPLRTVESGRQRYVFAVIRVPPDWTLRFAHEVSDRIESDVEAALPGTETFITSSPRSCLRGDSDQRAPKCRTPGATQF